jgi:glutamyl-tRNA synthetase
LIAAFSLEGIGGGNAVFNPEKLEWFNQQHIGRLSSHDLTRRLRPSFESAHIWDDRYASDMRVWFADVLDLLKPRVRRLEDFASQGRYFFTDAIEYDQAAVAKHLRLAGMEGHLEALSVAWGSLDPFDAATAETRLRSVADLRGIKAALLIHAVRVAVTGRAVSPGLFDVVALLGADRTRARLRAAQALATQLSQPT